MRTDTQPSDTDSEDDDEDVVRFSAAAGPFSRRSEKLLYDLASHGRGDVLFDYLVGRITREHRSDLLRHYFAMGFAQCRAEVEGRTSPEAEALAQSIVSALTTRGLDVPVEVEFWISICTDLAQLADWRDRAGSVAEATDLLVD